MISIDTIAVENEIADNMYQRSELDYLIYDAPLEYVDLSSWIWYNIWSEDSLEMWERWWFLGRC